MSFFCIAPEQQPKTEKKKRDEKCKEEEEEEEGRDKGDCLFLSEEGGKGRSEVDF